MRPIQRLSVAAVLTVLLAIAAVPRRLDNAAFDAFSRARLVLCPRRDGDLPVVIAIDGPALREYGRWPWPRDLLARLLREVDAGGARAIGLDILLSEPGPGDRELAAAMRNCRVILAQRLDLSRRGRKSPRIGRIEPPLPILSQAAAGCGFIDFFPDADGVARRMPAGVRDGNAYLPSLASALHGAAAGRPPRAWEEILLDIRPKPGDWPAVSARDVLAGTADPARWRGRPVLIGVTAPGVPSDRFPTPVRALGLVPGVYLHAYAYAGLAAESGLSQASSAIPVVLAVLLLFASLPSPRPLWHEIACWAGSLALIAALSAVLFLGGRWLAPALPAIAGTCTVFVRWAHRTAETQRRERRMHSLFARFVPPRALKLQGAEPRPVLDGNAREVSVIFADLRGFSAWAEGRPPEQVAAMLNEHLAAMSRVIAARGGMVDKYIGDAVMGLFGASRTEADHRRLALAAAAEIRNSLARPGFLPVGIGVASGQAVVGNIGGHDRLEYTAVGEPVNLAARLEEMAGPGEIVVAAACFDADKPGPDWEGPDDLRIPGWRKPVPVYRNVTAITDKSG